MTNLQVLKIISTYVTIEVTRSITFTGKSQQHKNDYQHLKFTKSDGGVFRIS